MKDFEEKLVSGEEVFRGEFLRLQRDVVRLPDGTKAVREYVRHPGAVAIVALTVEGAVILERQHRYPLRRDFVEIPAGKLEPGEAHLATGKRELLEGLCGRRMDPPRPDPQRHRLFGRGHRVVAGERPGKARGETR